MRASLGTPTGLLEVFVTQDCSTFVCGVTQQLFSHSFPTAENLRRIEKVWELKFPPGFNKDIKFMAHNREPLRVAHHFLIVYAWSQAVSLLVGIAFHALGYER